MFHLLAGVPSTLKTTIALSYAAIISSGGTWPDGTRATAKNVLMWSNEDNPNNTLKPRLIRMGANLSRVYIIKQTRAKDGKPRPFSPSTDLPELEAKAKEIGDVALLTLDPVVATVPATRNSHNNVETRVGLQPVVDFAEATNVAVLGITHLTKGTSGKDPLERITGSLAFGALPRVVTGATKNMTEGDDQPAFIMTRIKNNIGPSGGGFGYNFDVARLP
jgi:putative DNA primase/helicase